MRIRQLALCTALLAASGVFESARADSPPVYLLKWGSQGNGPGQFNFPLGVAVDGVGNVYVTDTQSKQIEKFDSNGNWLLAWGSPGSGPGQFDIPLGIAVSAIGEVYVTDSSNGRVQVFNSSGGYVRAWGAPGR